MNPINKFRLCVGEYFFKSDMAKVTRKMQIANLKNAKNIGLVYDATDETKYPTICTFVKYLQEQDKTVKAIGFINYMIIPHYCFPKLSYDYFNRKNLNWYYKPTSSFITDFLNNEFDILIDLNLNNAFPLKYITGLSIAKYKIGRYSEEYKQLYDFMITTKDDVTLKEYINHVVHYLSVINIKNHE